MTFIEQSDPNIKRKLQCLDETLEMIPSWLVYLVFKVYHAWETRKLMQVTIFLETVQGKQKEMWDLKGKRKYSLGNNQYDHCQKNGHWRKDCPKLKRKNRKDKNPHHEMLDGRVLTDDRAHVKI